MTRNWKLLAPLALAALALTAAHAPAGAKQPADGAGAQSELSKKLDALDQKLFEELKKISEAINALNDRSKSLEANDADNRLKITDSQIKIANLEKQVNQLRADLETLQKRLPRATEALYPPGDKTGYEEIRARLGQIEQILNRLQSKGGVAKYGPSAGTGKIVMVNQYPETLLYVINQRAIRVPSGQTATLDNQPAGPFTYEVISPTAGSRGTFTRELAPGETYTLTARP